MNELALYQYNAAALTVAPVPRSGNYTICAPDGAPAILKRGIDFSAPDLKRVGFFVMASPFFLRIMPKSMPRFRMAGAPSGAQMV